LLVARPSRRGFRVIDAFSRIIRLGEGVSSSGRLSEAAIDRTIEALKVCASKIAKHRVERAGLIATEACRMAANAPEFLGRVHRETGIEITVVSRETEAKLAVSGCASLIDASCDYVLIFDIGGGSSELIWLDLPLRPRGRRRSPAERLEVQNCISAWTSLPVGVATLAERFGGKVVDPAIFAAMVQHVMEMLLPFEAQHAMRARLSRGPAHLLGTSGTVTTLAGIHLGLPRYERNRVDGCWLSAGEVRTVTAGLLGSSYEQRVAEPCVGRERADLVLAGCAILEALMQTWPCQRLRVADRGLREGILATLMAEDGVYGVGSRVGSRFWHR
jgi:exopolyphosphatase/guanosine-5'-triphosphate,3'-diphosphate pyrophosphatase